MAHLLPPSPWGTPQHIGPVRGPNGEELPGILFVDCPGHGGYYVPPKYRDRMPAPLLRSTFRQQGFSGWFEEDCDWAYVCLVFPELFPPEATPHAVRAVQAFGKPEAVAWLREKGLTP